MLPFSRTTLIIIILLHRYCALCDTVSYKLIFILIYLCVWICVKIVKMPLVIGHSQAKYLSEYLRPDEFSVFSYPGYRVCDFLDTEDIFEVAPYFSVSDILWFWKMKLLC